MVGALAHLAPGFVEAALGVARLALLHVAAGDLAAEAVEGFEVLALFLVQFFELALGFFARLFAFEFGDQAVSFFVDQLLPLRQLL